MKPQSTTSQSQHAKSEFYFKIKPKPKPSKSCKQIGMKIRDLLCAFIKSTQLNWKKKVWKIIFWSFLFGLTYFFRNCICPQQAVLCIWYDRQRYTYRVLQTIQIKLIISCVWAERAVLGSAKTALKLKHEIQIG